MKTNTIKNEYEFFKSVKNALELQDNASFTNKSICVQLANDEKQNALNRFQLWVVPLANDRYKIDVYVGKNLNICDMKKETAVERKFSRVSLDEAIELYNKAQKALATKTAVKKTESETA